jgi:hypothetical protein
MHLRAYYRRVDMVWDVRTSSARNDVKSQFGLRFDGGVLYGRLYGSSMTIACKRTHKGTAHTRRRVNKVSLLTVVYGLIYALNYNTLI